MASTEGCGVLPSSQCKTSILVDLHQVVRRVDNFIQQINPCLADKIGTFLILVGQRAI